MALIVDPDDLNQATEVTIDTGALTIDLNIAGNLSADGVTGQCLYSFLKEEWKNDSSKTPFQFPMVAITPESFEFVEGWEPADDAARKLLRSCGWAEVASGGAVKRRYFGAITLGNIDSTSKTVGDKAYYYAAGDTTSTEFTYAGPVDEAVQYFGDAANGNFDNTSTVYTIAIRQAGKTFGSSTTTAIGLSSLSPIAYRFPVSEGTDLNINASDALISLDSTVTFTNATNIVNLTAHPLTNGDKVRFVGGTPPAELSTGTTYFVVNANANDFQVSLTAGGSAVAFTDDGTPTTNVVSWPYNGMSITYRQVAVASNTLYGTDLSGGPYNFGIEIAGSGGTTTEIYEFSQYQLRQSTDIDAETDAPTQPGLLQDSLLQFIGSTLRSLTAANADGGGTGVAVTGFDANFTNSLELTDNLDAGVRTFPFVAAGNLNFSQTLVDDAGGEYWLYYTTNPAGDFGTATAVLVDDAAGTDIQGLVSSSSVSFDYDYDGNTQGGRTPGTDADVTLVAIGLDNAQHVIATGTITQSTGISITATSALERNYSNP